MQSAESNLSLPTFTIDDDDAALELAPMGVRSDDPEPGAPAAEEQLELAVEGSQSPSRNAPQSKRSKMAVAGTFAQRVISVVVFGI